jgi:hypothetical protein
MRNLLFFAAIGLLSTLIGFTIVLAAFASGWPVHTVLKTAASLTASLGAPVILIQAIALTIFSRFGKL